MTQPAARTGDELAPREPRATRAASRSRRSPWPLRLLRGLLVLVGQLLLVAYLLVSRGLLMLGAIYLVLYFLLGSRPMKQVIQQAVSDNIPGSITAAAVQWGPLPWELRIADGRVFDEHGREAIRVRALDAEIDLGATLPGLVRFIGDTTKNPMRVHLETVDLLEPHATVVINPDGHINIERAFVIDGWLAPGERHDDPPIIMDLTAATVRVIDGSGTVEGPGSFETASGLDTVTDFGLVGDFHTMFFAELVRLAEADVRLDFVPFTPGTVHIPVHDLVVDDYRWSGVGFAWSRARAALGPRGGAWGSLDAAGWLDANADLARWAGGARVHLDETAPVTAALTGGAIAGALDLDVRGGGDVEQVSATWALSSERLGIGPVALADVQAHGRVVPRGAEPSGYYHDVLVSAATGVLEGPGPPGRVRLQSLAWAAPAPGPLREVAPRDLDFAFEVDGLDGRTLLPELVPGLPSHLIALVAGRWSARGNFARDHDPERGVTTTEIALAEGRWLRQPGDDPTAPAGDRTLATLEGAWSVAGALRLVDAPFSSTLAVERVVFDRGEDRMRLAGSIDLGSGRLDLEPYLRVGNVAGLAERLGLPRATGRFVLKGARASGTLADPRVTGVLNWTDASLDGRRLDQVRAELDLHDGVLHIGGARSDNALGAVALDGRIDLADPGLAFDATRLEVSRLTLATLLSDLGPDVKVDVRSSRLSGALGDPLDTLRGRAHILISDAIVGGERVDSIEAELEADGRALTFRNVRVTARAGSATGELALDLASQRVRGRIDVSGLDVRRLTGVARATPELGAVVGAHLGLSGTLTRPTFIGTIDLSGVRWGDIQLGDAQLAVQTLPDGHVDLSALDQTFFRGLSLDRAELTLDGLVPRRLSAAIRATDLALADLSPSISSDMVSVVATALAEVDIALGPSAGGATGGAAGAAGTTSLRVSARPGDVRVTLADRGQRWSNTTPLYLERSGDVLRVEPVGFGPEGQAAALELCGTVGRQLDVLVAGRVELVLVPGIADLFSVADGRFLVADRGGARPAPAGPSAGRRRLAEEASARCLATPDALVIGGSADAPELSGRLVADGVVLVPRGSGRELRLTDGSAIVLVPGTATPDGRQRIEIPADGGLSGELDDGTFALAGHIALAGFRPADIELDITGADLFLQSPGEFALTASPRGHLSVRELDGPSPSAFLSGALTISEGRYSKSFDTIAQAIGGAAGTRTDAYSESLLSRLPWLGRTRLDVDVTAADFQIQTALPLAKTDLPARLDLSLGGTFDDPLLYRRIDLMPGGVLTYFVFERAFQVQQGSIDFDGDAARPLVDVTARTTITYLARASTTSLDEDEKEVSIILRMTGRVPDLKIELSTDDATLDQADIQSLLLTGKPRGDLDRAQESRVVSADIATLLNTVLSAPFVKTASVAVGQEGALEYRLGTCFAPNLCFDTTTVADDTETTLRAKFSLSIGDDLVCEGTLRRSDGSTTSQETYAARCRYRVPLE